MIQPNVADSTPQAMAYGPQSDGSSGSMAASDTIKSYTSVAHKYKPAEPLLSLEAAPEPSESDPSKGITVHFGGGPVGGGGQVMTSPLSLVKSLLFPLFRKPKLNLNGKIVFGVVLENNSKPKYHHPPPPPHRYRYHYG